MRENPVKSPMVPPIADNLSSNFAAWSLVIVSNVGVSNMILTNFKSLFHAKSKGYYELVLKDAHFLLLPLIPEGY